MLFKVSLKNIQKSFKDYAIYFFTLILGVSIFYVFNAMESQTVLLDVSSSTQEIIKLMNTMLSGVSIFVSFILGFLIIYASQFLMKRRKKEFGIYMTLGMGKGKISKILLLETLLIGILSLGFGIFIGVGLSQLMSLLVASLFEADMSSYTFVFSFSAMVKTILYFGIMYILVMIFNTFSVGKCKLIDLLYSGKKNEKVKFKNPWVCTIIFVISCCILGYAYYSVTIDFMHLTDEKIPFILMLGAVGTFLLFWSLSGLIIKICMSTKKMYYKNINSFTIRQISSKINTTVFSMTVISLLLFLTIVVFGSALSLKNSVTQNLKDLTPIDFEASKNWNVSGNYYKRPYTPEEIEDSKISARESLEKYLDVSSTFQDILEVNMYKSDITLATILGPAKEKIKKKFPYLNIDNPEDLMRLSDYNKVAAMFGNEQYTLESNEYVMISDFDSLVDIRNDALKQIPKIMIGRELSPKYDECKDGFVIMSANHVNFGIIVVPDDVINVAMKSENYFLANYKASTSDEKKAVEKRIESISIDEMKSVLEMTTKLSVYESTMGLGAMVTFIGLYLGIIFLLSSAAILALKELSESTDNKERYMVLRRIGVDEKVLKKSLFRQIAVFFFFPLFIACIHSVFGIIFANHILETVGNVKILSSILLTATFLIVIYGGYFLITYICSKNIICEKE